MGLASSLISSKNTLELFYDETFYWHLKLGLETDPDQLNADSGCQQIGSSTMVLAIQIQCTIGLKREKTVAFFPKKMTKSAVFGYFASPRICMLSWCVKASFPDPRLYSSSGSGCH
jgi:hypothetical protein